MSKDEKLKLVEQLTVQMENAAKSLDFEAAANLRDAILELKVDLK